MEPMTPEQFATAIESARSAIGSVIVGDGNGRFYEPAPERNFIVGVNAELSF